MESIGDFEYNPKEMLGHGAFACVFQGNIKAHKSTKVAIKRVTRKNLAKSSALLDKEITILRELSSVKHENIVHLLHVDQNVDFVFLVMEFCNGGDLNEYLTVQKTLSEDTIRLFTHQIASAMKRINSLGIVHRDLKPQNLLLCFNTDPIITRPAVGGKKKRIAYPDASSIVIKLADFGFARVLSEGNMAGTMCGSPMYMAPEVLMMWHYDCKADLWSIGTILYQCLTGHAPFYANSPQALKDFYEKNAGLRPKIPAGTTEGFADLLCRMLRRNPRERIEFDDFFRHRFLIGGSKTGQSDLRRTPNEHRTPEILRRRNSSTTDIPPNISSSPLARPILDSPTPRRRSQRPVQTVPEAPTAGQISVPRAAAGRPKDDFVHVLLKPHRESVAGAREDDFIMVDSDMEVSENAANLYKDANAEDTRHVHPEIRETALLDTVQTRPTPSSAIELCVNQGANQGANQGVVTRPQRSHTDPKMRYEVPNSSRHQMIPRQRPNSSSSDMPDLAKLSPPPVKFTLGRRNSFSSSSGGGTPPSLYAAMGARCGSPSHNLLLGVSPSARPTSMGRFGGVLSPIRDSSGFSAESTSPLVMAINNRSRTSPSGCEGYFSRNRRSLTAPSDIAEYVYQDRVQHSPRSPVDAFSGLAMLGTSPVDDFLPPAPEGLCEDALMKNEHKQTMDRLRFLALTVEFIGQLALERASPLVHSASAKNEKLTNSALRDMEQLVLYIRSQQYLSACFTLAQESIEQGKLKVTQKVFELLTFMNGLYHRHYIRSQQLKKEVHQAMLTPGGRRRWRKMKEVNADRLIFEYIVKLCREAVQSEILEKGKECFSSYQTAHVLLHCLCTHTARENERDMLEQCKQRVEHRLLDLGYSPDPLRTANTVLSYRS